MTRPGERQAKEAHPRFGDAFHPRMHIFGSLNADKIAVVLRLLVVRSWEEAFERKDEGLGGLEPFDDVRRDEEDVERGELADLRRVLTLWTAGQTETR